MLALLIGITETLGLVVLGVGIVILDEPPPSRTWRGKPPHLQWEQERYKGNHGYWQGE